MEEIIEEFLKQEEINSDYLSLYSTVTKKRIFIKIEDFLDNYNKFLRKKSYLK
jgi:hypothetical protein